MGLVSFYVFSDIILLFELNDACFNYVTLAIDKPDKRMYCLSIRDYLNKDIKYE